MIEGKDGKPAYDGRLGGTGKNCEKSSPDQGIRATEESLTSKVRSVHDKHPMKSGKSNRA